MSSELSIGAVFAERYRVERRLATGGMGAVYEVVHIETNRRRALKVLHPKFMQSDALRKRFRQEARVAAEIESEHIVDIFDAGIDSETEMPFLVMELLRGEDLRARVRRDGPLPYEEVIRCLHETCLALEKTHKANIVHRDLKPDNLFLCEREHGPPRIKVLDFGIAKIIADGAMETQITQSLGTPLYMAPEQFSINSSVSPATDIFALGLIAYTMLVGKPYWHTESQMARSPIAFAIHAAKGPQESPVARAESLNVKLPAAFDEWFFRATAVKPTDRFSSATAAIAELAEVLGVAMSQEAVRGKSSPSLIEISMVPADEIVDENSSSDLPQPAGQHSASLHAVRTVGNSGLAESASHTRRRPFFVVAGILGLLLVGPVIDGLLRMPAPRESIVTSASPAAELPSTETTEASSSLPTRPESFVPAPPLRDSSAAAPSASTSSSAPPAAASASTKTTVVRPIGTTRRNGNGSIWNND